MGQELPSCAQALVAVAWEVAAGQEAAEEAAFAVELAVVAQAAGWHILAIHWRSPEGCTCVAAALRHTLHPLHTGHRVVLDHILHM